MEIKLSEEMLQTVYDVALSNARMLNGQLDTCRQMKKEIPPKTETDIRRIDTQIKEIEKDIENAEVVCRVFSDFLENYRNK